MDKEQCLYVTKSLNLLYLKKTEYMPSIYSVEAAIKNVPYTSGPWIYFLLGYNDRATRKTIFCFYCNLFQVESFATNLLD